MSIAFLPENLNLEKILHDYPPEFEYDIDNFRYIISTIIRLKATYKDYRDLEYVPLSSKILQDKIRSYKKYLDYLNQVGVIAINRQFVIGEHSRGYKLAAKYAECDSSPVKLIKASLNKKNRQEWKDDRKFTKEYWYLEKWFNTDLQIDKAGADGFLVRLCSRQTESGDTGALEKYRSNMYSVKMIEMGIYNLSVDDNVKRFHSILTNLKSGLRNFITYQGQQLCSVDIKNSQPFFSILFFNPDFYENFGDKMTIKHLSAKIYRELLPIIPNIQTILTNHTQSNQSTPSNYIMLVKPDVNQASTDLEQYCTLVDKGLLYSFISDRYFEATGIRLDVAIPEEKRKIKKAVFYTMYSANNLFDGERGVIKHLFCELFPTVYEIFALIKKKNHRHLPVILQLIESEIVIRRTAKILSKKNKSLPIFTIHDCIVTLSENEAKDMVWQELKAQCMNIIGLRPTLSAEIWSNQ